MERFNEAVQLFDNQDLRTFDDIYKDKMGLFEDVDDVIDPRMKKLFEETYKTNKQETTEENSISESFDKIYQSCKLKEEIPPGGHNFTGDEAGPSGDGVPASHNKPSLSGSDPATTQSGQDYSSNTKFFESVYNESSS